MRKVRTVKIKIPLNKLFKINNLQKINTKTASIILKLDLKITKVNSLKNKNISKYKSNSHLNNFSSYHKYSRFSQLNNNNQFSSKTKIHPKKINKNNNIKSNLQIINKKTTLILKKKEIYTKNRGVKV